MNWRYLVVGIIILGALAVAPFALATYWSPPSSPLAPDQTYPPGAGPDQINFSALNADSADVSQAPREHWGSYAIIYTAPPERRLVEGDYYVNSSTGEIIAERWYGAKVYRNGTAYAYVQPAERLPNEQQRERFESDDSFTYENTTNTYYRYDSRYGQIAPTNIGRHTKILESYTWEATNTTTHHGISVITYRVTGTRTDDSGVPRAFNGTLQLGAENGIIYTYDLTLDGDEDNYHYTYDVRPAPFPDHDWVDWARDIATNATNSSSE